MVICGHHSTTVTGNQLGSKLPTWKTLLVRAPLNATGIIKTLSVKSRLAAQSAAFAYRRERRIVITSLLSPPASKRGHDPEQRVPTARRRTRGHMKRGRMVITMATSHGWFCTSVSIVCVRFDYKTN